MAKKMISIAKEIPLNLQIILLNKRQQKRAYCMTCGYLAQKQAKPMNAIRHQVSVYPWKEWGHNDGKGNNGGLLGCQLGSVS